MILTTLVNTLKYEAMAKPKQTKKHNLDDDFRLSWARAIKSDVDIHSQARIRRACHIFLSDGTRATQEEVTWAHNALIASA